MLSAKRYETVTHPRKWFCQSTQAASTPYHAVDRQQAQQHQTLHVVQAPTPAHASSPQLRTAAPGKPASVDMHEQARIVQLQQQEQQA